MTLELTPHQQQLIDLAMQSGAYRRPEDVLEQALEIVRARLTIENWMSEERETLAAHIGKGYAQALRGELINGDEVLQLLHQRRKDSLG